MDDSEPFPLTRTERGYLIDALMTHMHAMKQVKENDLSELPVMQGLLERLMALPESVPRSEGTG